MTIQMNQRQVNPSMRADKAAAAEYCTESGTDVWKIFNMSDIGAMMFYERREGAFPKVPFRQTFAILSHVFLFTRLSRCRDCAVRACTLV